MLSDENTVMIVKTKFSNLPIASGIAAYKVIVVGYLIRIIQDKKFIFRIFFNKCEARVKILNTSVLRVNQIPNSTSSAMNFLLSKLDIHIY